MTPQVSRVTLLVLLGTAIACRDSGTGISPLAARIPLPDLAGNSYKGFVGGLYPSGGNTEPASHAAARQARAQAVTPLDASGAPSAGGKVVLLSLGMSNTTQEFCSGSSTTTNCSTWSFMGQAAADVGVNHATLAIVNGARGGQDAQTWEAATDANYDSVRDNRLIPLGLTERQVQVVWVKQADAGPRDSLASAQADAFALESRLANIARALKTRYPNLKMIFLSSRIYAGYATTTLNPEPYAYESGFAVKWVIQAQIDQMANGGVVTGARAGDQEYNSSAPWLAGGPHPLAGGITTPQSDGLNLQASDFVQDGAHPPQNGQQKGGAMVLAVFQGSPFTQCWFMTGGICS